jgi:hypothetical protein
MKPPLSPSTPYKMLVMKVFAPDNKKVQETRIFKAVKGHVFNEGGIQRCLDDMADYLEKKYPGQDFRLVELSGGRFNFINATGEAQPEQIVFEAHVEG